MNYPSLEEAITRIINQCNNTKDITVSQAAHITNKDGFTIKLIITVSINSEGEVLTRVST